MWIAAPAITPQARTAREVARDPEIATPGSMVAGFGVAQRAFDLAHTLDLAVVRAIVLVYVRAYRSSSPKSGTLIPPTGGIGHSGRPPACS